MMDTDLALPRRVIDAPSHAAQPRHRTTAFPNVVDTTRGDDGHCKGAQLAKGGSLGRPGTLEAAGNHSKWSPNRGRRACHEVPLETRIAGKGRSKASLAGASTRSLTCLLTFICTPKRTEVLATMR